MIWWIRFATKNALRAPRRSLLTASTVLLGTALMVLGLAWLDGVVGGALRSVTAVVGEVRVVTPGFEAREVLMPLYENIAESAPVVAAIEAQGARAYPIVRAPVSAAAGEELGEVYCELVGAPQAYFDEVLTLGGMPITKSGAVLGARLAADLDVEVGEQVLLLGQTQDGSISPLEVDVLAVVRTGDVITDRRAHVSLERARWSVDLPEGAVEVLVFSGEPGEAVALAAALRELEALDGLTVQAWRERDPYGMAAAAVDVIYFALAGAITLVTALGVLNTMMSSVLERTAEVGVLRAMGMSRAGVVSMFMVEGAAIGALGSALGVLLGQAPARYLETHGVALSEALGAGVSVPIKTTLYTDFTPELAAMAFALGLGAALLGATLPALRAAGVSPVEAMRARR